MIAPHIHMPYHMIGHYLSFIIEHRINLELYFSSNTLDETDYSEIEKLLETLTYNPSFTIHAPFMDLSPGAVDSKIRAITIERFNQVFSFAEIIKPEVIVFHSGYEKWKYALKVDVWLENSLKTWKEFIKRAEELNTKIAIENIFEDEPGNLRLLMENLGSEFFGLCFDTGHFNLFSKTSLKEWLNQTKDYIFEFHLHDNNRTSDAHLAIGEGNFDFDTLFYEFKGNNVVYTIEGHTEQDVLKSLERLKKYTETK
ncbi:MAG: sugar phosphate isomerase/epimerase [Nitrospirae bacterium]|jgi:sugar phosphate isomerase/epimerase|nr:sugar phosphate isomerase/epimerase [Nitrospirota bacterium]